MIHAKRVTIMPKKGTWDMWDLEAMKVHTAFKNCVQLKIVNHILCRFIESGRFKGFMRAIGRKALADQFNVPIQDCFLWPVYNHCDLLQQQQKRKKTGEITNTASHPWTEQSLLL